MESSASRKCTELSASCKCKEPSARSQVQGAKRKEPSAWSQVQVASASCKCMESLQVASAMESRLLASASCNSLP